MCRLCPRTNDGVLASHRYFCRTSLHARTRLSDREPTKDLILPKLRPKHAVTATPSKKIRQNILTTGVCFSPTGTVGCDIEVGFECTFSSVMVPLRRVAWRENGLCISPRHLQTQQTPYPISSFGLRVNNSTYSTTFTRGFHQ